jgi:hypothetical protein
VLDSLLVAFIFVLLGFFLLSGFLLAAMPNTYTRFRDVALWRFLPRDAIPPERRAIGGQSRVVGGIIALVAAWMAFRLIQSIVYHH